MSKTPILQMNNISKTYGTVTALKNVDLTLYPSEVLGLVGDNGAGKTTLIKILLGLVSPDSGEILLDGKKIKIKSPRDARMMGLEPVYQDTALVGLMNVSRNFFLARELVKKIGPIAWLDQKAMRKKSMDFLNDIGVHVRSANELVMTLSGGERQSIAIGRAIYFGAKLLVLDEPTAALSVKETNKVLHYIQEARKRGLSVIFITHNIYHVHSVADRFTVLDRAKKIGDYKKEDVTPEEIMHIISTGDTSKTQSTTPSK